MRRLGFLFFGQLLLGHKFTRGLVQLVALQERIFLLKLIFGRRELIGLIVV